MSKKPRFNIKLRLPEIVLFFLLLISSVSLGFKSGSFILNIKQIGFSIFSSVEKSVNFVYSSITNTFNAVSELRQLRKDYNDLVLKLENYEEMQRSNAENRKTFQFHWMKKIFLQELFQEIWIRPILI